MAGGNITNLQNYYPWTKDKSFNWQNDSTNRLVIVVRANLDRYLHKWSSDHSGGYHQSTASNIKFANLPQLPANPTAQQLQTYQQMLNQYHLDATQMQRNWPRRSKIIILTRSLL